MPLTLRQVLRRRFSDDRTLRQHVQEAERIWSIGGVKTLMPKKEPPAPVKVSVSNAQLIYAVSIHVVIYRHDRTGLAKQYLLASDEAASTVWHSIPECFVCSMCLGRVSEERPGKGRVWCPRCDVFVKPRWLPGLVSVDICRMVRALRHGGIPTRGEEN